ncbi:MAG: methyltransferase [Candidatus Aminicenantales bacterium]
MLSTPVYIVAFVGLIVFAFIVFRIFVRRSYLRRGRLTWLSSSLELLVFFLFGTLVWLDLPSGWPPKDVHPILRAVSWLCIAIGLSAMFILIFWFGWLRAMGQNVDALIQSGPYRMTRNPQIIACFIAVFGYALFWPSWHTLGWVILFSVMAHVMVLTEEEHLRNIFGERYIQYCTRAPRYMGVRCLFSRLAL